MKSLTIAVDLDNTMVDHLGQRIRPGMAAFLERLRAQGHTLIVFTSSTRDRARIILRDHDLAKYFTRSVFREDYDAQNAGRAKDLRLFGADVLIDDDPGHVAFVESIGLHGIRISSFRGERVNPAELDRIFRAIAARNSPLQRFRNMLAHLRFGGIAAK